MLLHTRCALHTHFLECVKEARSLVTMRLKLAVEVQYLGLAYIGWQPQPNEEGSRSVYDVLHAALSACGLTSGPIASGRTDKGVNAMSQWCTVTVRQRAPIVPGDERELELTNLRDAINRHLPDDVRCLQICDARSDAHAMTCSAGKTYSYFIIHNANGALEAACAHGWRGACLVVQDTLDVELMDRASQGLVGKRDYRNLCATKDPTKGTVRCISHASVEPLTHLHFPLLGCFDCNAPERPVALGRCNRCSAASAAAAAASATATATENFECSHAMSGVDLHDAGEPSDDIGCERAEEPSSSNHSSHSAQLLRIRFCGDGFLKHQVRRMVGILLRVGRGEEPVEVTGMAAPEVRDELRGETTRGDVESSVLAETHEPVGVQPSPRNHLDPCSVQRHLIEAPANGLWLETVNVERLFNAPP